MNLNVGKANVGTLEDPSVNLLFHADISYLHFKDEELYFLSVLIVQNMYK